MCVDVYMLSQSRAIRFVLRPHIVAFSKSLLSIRQISTELASCALYDSAVLVLRQSRATSRRIELKHCLKYFVPAFLPLLDPSQGPGMKLFIPSNYSVVDNSQFSLSADLPSIPRIDKNRSTVFVQSTKGFNGTGYDLHGDSFGLIDKSEDRWTRFRDYVEALNAAAGEDTTYKVIYIARHGQGVSLVRAQGRAASSSRQDDLPFSK